MDARSECDEDERGRRKDWQGRERSVDKGERLETASDMKPGEHGSVEMWWR